MKSNSFRHIITLSSFLDEKLSKRENTRVMASLKEDQESKVILDSLREVKVLLKHTPKHKSTWNFRLSPAMVGMKPPMPRSVPVFRMASLTAALFMIVSFTFTNLAPAVIGPRMAAESIQFQGGSGGGCGYENPADCPPEIAAAPAYGIGGGAPEADTTSDRTSATQEVTVPDTNNQTSEPEALTMQQPLPRESIEPKEAPQPMINSIFQLNPLQLVLLATSFAIGGLAIVIRLVGTVKWRKQL